MPLSPEHKRKISEGLRKYHASCNPKKPKTELQKEINRLQKISDRVVKEDKKKDLRKEIAKLKRML